MQKETISKQNQLSPKEQSSFDFLQYVPVNLHVLYRQISNSCEMLKLFFPSGAGVAWMAVLLVIRGFLQSTSWKHPGPTFFPYKSFQCFIIFNFKRQCLTVCLSIKIYFFWMILFPLWCCIQLLRALLKKKSVMNIFLATIVLFKLHQVI